MDPFTLLIAVILVGLSLQTGQNWLIFGTIILLIVGLRNLSATIVLLVALVLFFVSRNSIDEFWPFILFGLMILALLLGVKAKEQEPDMYAPGGDMGMMGGGMGGF
ncbi:MAG: hypothetical protein Q7S92_00405 [Candidatus Diapherotrites archaeon]|nr:hypothetical protein [Candidatus Diapherotrites archaeon]